VVEEIARVNEAIHLLEQNDAQGFGRLMLETHRSLRDLYEVSLPELDILVESAAGLEGCLGARLTGAGFGGCTVNLVQKIILTTLSNDWERFLPQRLACRLRYLQPSPATELRFHNHEIG